MSQTAIVRHQPSVPIQEFTEGQIDLIKNAIMPGANNAELSLFIEYARRTGLDPFARQLVPIKTWDKEQHRYRWEFMTGIDGLRLVAQRTGEYDGTEGPFFREKGGEWQDYWDGEGAPHECKILVYRKGASRGFPGRVKFQEFVRRNRQGQPYGNWATHPEHMLAVRAESHALRKAFPRETAGLYVDYDDEGREIPRPVRQVVNPEAPASHAQIGELHRLSKLLEFSDEERHERAGVASFSDLTKGQAHQLIDEWLALVEDGEVEEGQIAEPGGEEGEASANERPAAGATVQTAPGSKGEPEDEVPATGVPPDAPADDPLIEEPGPHKNKRYSQVAEEDPGYLRGVIAATRSKKKAEIAQAWLDHWYPSLAGGS